MTYVKAGGMGSTCGTDAGKTALRKEQRKVRDFVPERVRATLDARILANLQASSEYQDADLVLTYVSMDSEVDTHGIIVEALESGKRVAIPRCTAEKTLEFVEISSLQGLHQSRFGMLEPDASLPALKTPEFVGSVCLVPGLVFDGLGNRIGYGGGYYDRFLAFYPGHKIALVRTRQLSCNELPHEAHDIAVDLLVTDQRIWRVNNNFK